jgi:hypothetical protein
MPSRWPIAFTCPPMRAPPWTRVLRGRRRYVEYVVVADPANDKGQRRRWRCATDPNATRACLASQPAECAVDEVRARRAAGNSIQRIAREMGMHRRTVRRFLATPEVPHNRPPRRLAGRRLALLTGGGYDAAIRQQTLRGAISWSYDLLSPDEQASFRRLAIFAGGSSLVAAQALFGGGTCACATSGRERSLDQSRLSSSRPGGEQRVPRRLCRTTLSVRTNPTASRCERRSHQARCHRQYARWQLWPVPRLSHGSRPTATSGSCLKWPELESLPDT